MKFLSSEKLSEHKYKTPEGYLICTDAILARTGKQTYRRSEVFADAKDDNTEIEIDRKPDEVFSTATLASFENKPITVEHPDEDVNSRNYQQHSVGFVRDVKKGSVNGQDVMLGTLVITDEKTIEEIENGEHTDLSCGYDCDIIDEANPQQRNIRGNHVALCQEGRAGIAHIVDSNKVKDINSFTYYKGFIFDKGDSNAPVFNGFDSSKVVQKIRGYDLWIVYNKNGSHADLYNLVNGNEDGFTVMVEPGKITIDKLHKYSYINPILVKAAKELEPTNNVVMEDSINDGYYWNDIRRVCIQNNWYTHGTNAEYDNMFENARTGKWNAEQIAKDIYEHSSLSVNYQDVLNAIKKLNPNAVADSAITDTDLIEGKTYTSKNGNKLQVKKVVSGYSDYDGEPYVNIYYDFETTDGKRGSSKCNTNDFFKMLRDSAINDSLKTYQVRTTKDSVEHIQLVKAKSLTDAINKMRK